MTAEEISGYISRIRAPDVSLETKIRVIGDIYRTLDSRNGRALLRDRPEFAKIIRIKAEEFTDDLFKHHIDPYKTNELRALCLATLNTVRMTLTRCRGVIYRPYDFRRTIAPPKKLEL